MTYGEVGRLMVGFAGSLSGGNLRLLLGDVLERFPDVQLDALEAGPDRMLSGLQARIVDIAIHASPLEEAGIIKRRLWSERLMVVLPKEDRLDKSESMFWTDLCKAAFVMPADRSGPRIAQIITANSSLSFRKARPVPRIPILPSARSLSRQALHISILRRGGAKTMIIPRSPGS